MKLLLIISLFFSSIALAQDSVTVKVQKTRTNSEGQHIVWLKDVKTRQEYITICDCKQLPANVKKGNTITLHRSQLQPVKQPFTKQDIEN